MKIFNGIVEIITENGKKEYEGIYEKVDSLTLIEGKKFEIIYDDIKKMFIKKEYKKAEIRIDLENQILIVKEEEGDIIINISKISIKKDINTIEIEYYIESEKYYVKIMEAVWVKSRN